MRHPLLPVLVLAMACQSPVPAVPDVLDSADVLADSALVGSDAQSSTACTGALLFGLPNAKTGLTAEACGPTCTCGGQPWTPETWTPTRISQLRGYVLAVPLPEVLTDPYLLEPPAPPAPETVCAVVREPGLAYALKTFASAALAESASAIPTHQGGCGVCSTLADLAVYAEQPDLTDPVRQCGLDFLGGPREDHIACLQKLGFTLPCAQIWYWNTLHTRAKCSAPCFATLSDPYHTADGSLNACLQCDEAESGAVFKSVAGRTRRNTGVPSAMCRPCAEVTRLSHAYGP